MTGWRGRGALRADQGKIWRSPCCAWEAEAGHPVSPQDTPVPCHLLQGPVRSAPQGRGGSSAPWLLSESCQRSPGAWGGATDAPNGELKQQMKDKASSDACSFSELPTGMSRAGAQPGKTYG